jgi:hypothetical protein
MKMAMSLPTVLAKFNQAANLFTASALEELIGGGRSRHNAVFMAGERFPPLV